MVMQSAEVRDFDDPAAVGCLLRPARRCILIQREVGSPLVIEVDNPTHTILSYGKSAIHSIHGSVVRSSSTRCSSSRGIPSAGAV